MNEGNPQKEILVQPLWPLLIDGFGYYSTHYGGIPSKAPDGRKTIKLTIGPSEVAKKRYDLQFGKEIDDSGVMFLEVLQDDLVPLNLHDQANQVWLYVKSLRHEETLISDREKFLKTELTARDKEVALLEAEVICMAEQLILANINPAKFLKSSLDIVEAIKKLAPEQREDRR